MIRYGAPPPLNRREYWIVLRAVPLCMCGFRLPRATHRGAAGRNVPMAFRPFQMLQRACCAASYFQTFGKYESTGRGFAESADENGPTKEFLEFVFFRVQALYKIQ